MARLLRGGLVRRPRAGGGVSTAGRWLRGAGILRRMSSPFESSANVSAPAAEPSVTSLCDATAYLNGLINRERPPQFAYSRLDLTPIRILLERLGNPQRGLRVLHIAGSKGKGSTALLVEAIFTAAGYRVGTFTSPHLESWTERFRIGGSDVSECRLLEAVSVVRPHLDALRQTDPPPSFFDAATAIALWLFAHEKVELAILEVGLGGRLDSTNIVEPALTCITSIELEHTDKLGPDLASIAREKAGILKPGCPVIVGDLPAEALRVVEARAAELAAASCPTPIGVEIDPAGAAGKMLPPVLRFGRDFGADVISCQEGRQRFRFWRGALAVECELAWLGEHQVHNAALALAAASELPGFDAARLLAAAQRALTTLHLPGRIEVLRRDARRAPQIVVDSAHTQMSARKLIDSLKCYEYDARELVLSISRDKNCERILAELLPAFDCVTVTCAEPTRSLDPEVLARQVARCGDRILVSVEPDPTQALLASAGRLAPRTLLCVAGSVYLAGIARKVLAAKL